MYHFHTRPETRLYNHIHSQHSYTGTWKQRAGLHPSNDIRGCGAIDATMACSWYYGRKRFSAKPITARKSRQLSDIVDGLINIQEDLLRLSETDLIQLDRERVAGVGGLFKLSPELRHGLLKTSRHK